MVKRKGLSYSVKKMDGPLLCQSKLFTVNVFQESLLQEKQETFYPKETIRLEKVSKI